jgi:branched-chain amino acid transport system substrate-binding protein
MITPSSTNPRVTQVGDYIFRVCFTDRFQGFVMATFATKTLKVHDVAILRDIKNDYSVGFADVFIENFRKSGGRIVSDESYSEGDTDFSAQLTSIRASNPQAILVPGYYTEIGLIARQARKLGITSPLLGGDGWDSPKLVEIGGEALNGCYFSNHYSVADPKPQIQTFVAKYKQKYKTTPDALAALGYDAARVLLSAMQNANSTDPGQIRQSLAHVQNFQGVTGNITIGKDRDAIKPAVILKVQDSKLNYVETIHPM